MGFNEDFYDPVSQMYADNLIDRNVFSIYVNRFLNLKIPKKISSVYFIFIFIRNQSNDFGGELFIGGNNPKYVGLYNVLNNI